VAKEFLARNQISFVEKDVSVDDQAQAELLKRNIRGVPTFSIGDDVVIGFDQRRILELVDHRVVECENCHTRLRVPIDKGSLKVTCPKCNNQFDFDYKP